MAGETLTEAQRRDLTALAERVEALQGPCRETDARVAVACGDIRMSNRSGNIAFFQEPVKQGDYAFLSGCVDGEEDAFRSLGSCLGVKHYTASIDAVVALIEKELPSHRFAFQIAPHHRRCQAWVQLYEFSLSDRVEAATPALALLAATLRARAALARKEG